MAHLHNKCVVRIAREFRAVMGSMQKGDARELQRDLFPCRCAYEGVERLTLVECVLARLAIEIERNHR